MPRDAVSDRAKPAPVAPTPTIRKRDEDDDIDPLKSRIDGIDKLGRTKKGEAAPGGYNAAKLRRIRATTKGYAPWRDNSWSLVRYPEVEPYRNDPAFVEFTAKGGN